MAMGIQSEERASSVSTALEMMKADIGSTARDKKLMSAQIFVIYKTNALLQMAGLYSQRRAMQIICAHMCAGVHSKHTHWHTKAGTSSVIFKVKMCTT